MEIASLHLTTELMFHRIDGQVIDRGAYTVVKTPANPSYYFGNALIYPNAPAHGVVDRWRGDFAKEFADIPEVRHQTFMWDHPQGERGAADEFVQQGFVLDHTVALVATSGDIVRPLKCADNVDVRPLQSNEDFETVIALQVACRDPGFEAVSYERFRRRQQALRRAHIARGRGQWFGAYVDGKLVADCGLFFEGSVGRYQMVGTHPEYRRQGICGRLVWEVALYGIKNWNLQKLVMLADEHYHAARIYESVGFKPAERSVSMWLPPSGDFVAPSSTP